MLTSARNIEPSLRRVQLSTAGSSPLSSALTCSAKLSGVTSGQMSETVSDSSSSMVYPPICACAWAFT